MKGGVTSGIIYPAAIAAIAQTYRLRSIGGTSAGAIGAAAAAAMEFGRRSGRNPQADRVMATLAKELGAPVDGEPLLLRLFEPDQDTARLFRLGLDLASAPEGKRRGKFVRILLGRAFMEGIAFAAIAIALLCWASPVALLSVETLVRLCLFLSLVPLMTAVRAGQRWLPRIRADLEAVADNGFGFCSGTAQYRHRSPRWRWPWRKAPAATVSPSLAQWLHGQFQLLAGLPEDEVLTFGDLWAAQFRVAALHRDKALDAAMTSAAEHAQQHRAALQQGNGAEASDAPEEQSIPLDLIPRDIELALVASDINRAQSVQLPFMRRDDRLYARKSDLAALFPDPIVDWMIAKARKGPDIDNELQRVITDPGERADYIRLPLPQDLPVLFGVRASLSFPFLFRAVRLYLIRPFGDGSGKTQLDEIWLADGGITSNFPIHLFDAPIPGRPTFCLNLLYHDDEFAPEVVRRPRSAEDGAEAEPEEGAGLAMSSDRDTANAEGLVYMLRTNKGRLSAYTRFRPGDGLGRLLRFGGRIVTTARQWGDNQLIDVPGYRDRIVHIRMQTDEGGFNFNMDEPKIEGLQERGELAGKMIAARFHPETRLDPFHPDQILELNWANHRFVRFRMFLAGLEVAASRFKTGWDKDRARAELPGADPAHVTPSVEQMAEEVRASASPFDSKVGYPFSNNQQADLALDMVKAMEALHALATDPAWRGIDFVKGKRTSPTPKSMLKLRPSNDSDPLAQRP